MVRDQVDKLLEQIRSSGRTAQQIRVGEDIWGTFVAEVTAGMDTISATTWPAKSYEGVPLTCGGVEPSAVAVD